MAAMKSPGVYIEEIPKFPPSIAPVETAIPAFIGYTEKANNLSPGDLINIPTKIGSISEYEAYFGEGANPEVDNVTLDDGKNFKSATVSNVFYMYDSLRLFYANGGGDCYIVSVGTYDAAGKTADDFTGSNKGITTLEKVDEPTILVFPDNSLLNDSDFYNVYAAALTQCNELMDRVGLFHVKEDDPKGDKFRSGIGINNLKYGMVYSPWLKVNFPKTVEYRAFKDVIQIGATPYNLGNLTDNSEIKTQVSSYELIISDIDNKINDAAKKISGSKTLRDKFIELEGKYQSDKSNSPTEAVINFGKLVNYMFEVARQVDALVVSTTAVSDSALKQSFENLIGNPLKGFYTTLISYDKELATNPKVSGYTAQYSNNKPSNSNWGGIFDTKSPDPSNVLSIVAMDNALPLLDKLFDQINDTWVNKVAAAAQSGTDDAEKISAATNAISGSKTLREKFTELEGTYNNSGKTVFDFMTLVNYMFEVARQMDVLVGSTSDAVSDALKTSFKPLITSPLQGFYTTLISYDKEFAEKINSYTVQFNVIPLPSATEWGGIFDANSPDPSNVLSVVAMDAMLLRLRPLFDQINNAWLDGVVNTARETETTKHKALLESFSLYKTIITGIQNASATVPPSGAVAGIYAYVDRTRGVWKAPANVSISGIIGPKDTFTASELGALNMDPNSGKSINAIRSFTGKGTLVYGARTLAGNDNEWRYVSVRRFFNFVEESVKKATEQFVFEPNDANTWVRVQAMIENFLTVLWRQGALQGVKPEHAFYVAVGLGKTMTPLDILEGRMIIEIGMAVVRPAEFIILKFSHKMAES